MPASESAWGIEIGGNAIKAIRLERMGHNVAVADFAVIPHKKVLTTPDLDQNEMIRLGLGQFISQKDIEGETLVMSVPGHAAFARFAKLPPVDPKKVPDIVKFEAVQQIPFPIEDVEWDYQTFLSADTPEVEVGIFAITRERVQQRLALYEELGISPEVLTLSPVAVYNAMAYDHDLEGRKIALIYLDIGTQATDLIVANQGQCWIRTFPLGGTHFTEAIANAFKLSYSKAEKLKKEAATSKYAKQIMQAMRPVFTDLLQDIQRSLGYYQSVHRDVELKTIVGIGSTFKIPGLRKFLGQQLQMEVVRLDEYRRIRVEGREAASFAENAVNMATAYGLALQGVGLAKIDANLVPVRVLREHIWHSKIKWFAAAAALAIVGGAVTFMTPVRDQAAVSGAGPSQVTDTIALGQRIAGDFRNIIEQHNGIGYKAENVRRLLDYRTVWPYLIHDVSQAIASADPQPELLSNDLAAIGQIKPGERNLIELLHLGGSYRYQPGQPQGERGGGARAAGATAAPGKRFIDVTMRVRLTKERPDLHLNQTVARWLRENAEPQGERAGVPYRILAETVSTNMPTMEIKTTAAKAPEGGRTGGTRGGERPPAGRGGEWGGGGLPTAPPGGERPPFGRGGDRDPQLPPIPGGEGGPPFPGGEGGPPIPGGEGRGAGGGEFGRPTLPGGIPAGEETRRREEQMRDLNKIAPVPQRPEILPPNTQYYETNITFTVELLPPQFADLGDRSASAETADGEESNS